MKKIILTIVSLWLALCSCGRNQTVGVNEFEKQLIATQSEQLIDVRTLQEFEESHIKNAKNIDFRNPNFRQEIEKLDKTKPVLVYCRSGVRSKSSLAMFQDADFKTVYNLDGGIIAWSNAKKPVE